MRPQPFILGLTLLSGSCVTEPIPLGALNASEELDEPLPTCGNGTVDSGESCDDGYNDNCGVCNADCTGPGSAPVCGDGDLCAAVEVCDDGFTDACGTCNADCTGPGTGSSCGDGNLCPQTELCDDGDEDDCNGCNNTCSGPGGGPACLAVSDENVFYPDEVYIWGTFLESDAAACTVNAIAHWQSPSRYVVGFDCDTVRQSITIQPVDQRLLYRRVYQGRILEFHCDECPGWAAADSYPTGTEQNDPVLETPPCQDEVSSFLAAPDGNLVYSCSTDGDYYDADGPLYSGFRRLLHLTFGGYALADDYSDTLMVVELSTGLEAVLTGLPTGDNVAIVAVRATAPNDFWLALHDGTTGELSRWRIGQDGEASSEITYAADPSGASSSWSSAALDSLGNLFTEGQDSFSGRDVIIRFRADGNGSAVVYSETQSVLKIYSAGLFTGP